MNPVVLRDSSLLVVDVQRGFTTLCPRELPVPGGLEIVPQVNRLLELNWNRIDASTDWHPPDHCSFLGQRDNLYPPHCVAGTQGAEFLPRTALEPLSRHLAQGLQPRFRGLCRHRPASRLYFLPSGPASRLRDGVRNCHEHLLFSDRPRSAPCRFSRPDRRGRQCRHRRAGRSSVPGTDPGRGRTARHRVRDHTRRCGRDPYVKPGIVVPYLESLVSSQPRSRVVPMERDQNREEKEIGNKDVTEVTYSYDLVWSKDKPASSSSAPFFCPMVYNGTSGRLHSAAHQTPEREDD